MTYELYWEEGLTSKNGSGGGGGHHWLPRLTKTVISFYPTMGWHLFPSSRNPSCCPFVARKERCSLLYLLNPERSKASVKITLVYHKYLQIYVIYSCSSTPSRGIGRNLLWKGLAFTGCKCKDLVSYNARGSRSLFYRNANHFDHQPEFICKALWNVINYTWISIWRLSTTSRIHDKKSYVLWVQISSGMKLVRREDIKWIWLVQVAYLNGTLLNV